MISILRDTVRAISRADVIAAGSVLAGVVCVQPLALGAGPFAQPKHATPAMEDLVKPRLISEHGSLVPGRTETIGITFDIDPAWHLYWINPGDSGGAIRAEVTAPKGLTIGSPQWPAPTRRIESGLVNFVYERSVTLLFPVEVSGDAGVGSNATIHADLHWVVCSDYCLFGDAGVDLSIPIAGAQQADGKASPDAARIVQARSRLPRPTEPTDGGLTAKWEGRTLVIAAPGSEEMVFFPQSPLDVLPVDIIRDGQSRGNAIRVEYQTNIDGAARVLGVLEIKRNGASTFKQIDIAGPKIG